MAVLQRPLAWRFNLFNNQPIYSEERGNNQPIWGLMGVFVVLEGGIWCRVGGGGGAKHGVVWLFSDLEISEVVLESMRSCGGF